MQNSAWLSQMVGRLVMTGACASLIVSCASNPAPVPTPLISPTPPVLDVPAVDQPAVPELTQQDIHPAVNTQTNANDTPLAAHEYVDGYPLANRVPGRRGYVFNPYTQNMVDVEGIPQLTKVMDPDDPEREKHVFRIPRD